MIVFSMDPPGRERKAKAYPVFEGSLLPVRIEPLNQQKKRVCLEDGTVLQLYNSEIRRFQIETDTVLEGTAYTEFMQCLCKRARGRALHLLQNADRPGTAIAIKLRQNGYPEEVVADALAYLDGYGYLDDTAYIQRYIAAHELSMSRQQIRQKLLQMGLAAEQIDKQLEETGSGEEQALARLAEKYCRNKDLSDADERRRIANRLLRRGFSYSAVCEALDGQGKFEDW